MFCSFEVSFKIYFNLIFTEKLKNLIFEIQKFLQTKFMNLVVATNVTECFFKCQRQQFADILRNSCF